MPEPIHPHRCPCKRCTGPRRAEELAALRRDLTALRTGTALRVGLATALCGALIGAAIVITLALLA